MSTVDFRGQLRKQLDFLTTSCDLYDSGKTNEAIRIAAALRIILHDTGSSTSLLNHLNASSIQLLSTCEDIPTRAQCWTNLTNIELEPAGGRAEYVPKLAAARTKRTISRSRWWSHEIVYLIADDSISVTRKDLVLAAANKDGGAHVDSSLDSGYEKILAGAGWKMTTHQGAVSKDIPVRNGHLAALRQMGYEILNSPEMLRLRS